MQLLKVLARVLEYPTEELQASKDALVAAVLEDSRLPRQNKEQLLRCVEMICDGDLLDMQENYVGMFDKGRATSLLLFEHVHGESRDRGQAMVDLMEEYRTNGLEIDARELPDYLPLFLEYLSTRPWDEIRNWLEDIHHILGLLGERLYQRESFYHVVMDSLLTLSGRSANRQELAEIVAAEERDDTPEALDKVWEEEMVKFVDDQGSSCSTGSVVGQRRRELEQTQTIHLSDQLMTDATPRQAGRA
ncbi:MULTISPECIES: nitrate reductase molybdenum cofactor assembly chaperone [Marinobacter]|jgi:nitrate reductase delta subunit|uniref:Nitrate reductase molybdenum cofactor assembly chaperone n=3 Tax=Marinobacter TaxID=2742 RepID=A0A5M3PYP2_9GAMM|nr:MULTISPECIES: nitrate reductase molybdenum cofactor assembly chaperone [Marinobacter]MBO6810974.1 nitrate reductase molybdenum cofactor assembly chaperone [Marinobacter sp.]MBO6873003.1 nitrate reductase molybdenum cofactor assembly chaperone [Marinobacter sp.]MBY6071322.1 nitrate reductase molybdenum cofactor assembly chaperone [Marinobacter salsuginis]MTI99849.1 nitrate reductase molybdenum cofactor assembly chaperone [Marinobacter adhaerens]ODM29946.1 nitrate reductase molybdenum cofacto|tara:strand:- start:248 stop:988 length:741 start_codon:yes stop_codon:yes gene_type:complete